MSINPADFLSRLITFCAARLTTKRSTRCCGCADDEVGLGDDAGFIRLIMMGKNTRMASTIPTPSSGVAVEEFLYWGEAVSGSWANSRSLSAA